MIEMIAKIVREKGKVDGLSLAGSPDLRLKMVGKCHNSTLKGDINCDVQRDDAGWIVFPFQGLQNLSHDDAPKQPILDDKLTHVVIFVKSGCTMAFAALDEFMDLIRLVRSEGRDNIPQNCR